MKNKDPLFWAARHIHRSLCRLQQQSYADPVPFLPALRAEQKGLERCSRLWHKAREHGWREAEALLLRRLLRHMQCVNSLSQVQPPLRLVPLPPIPDLQGELIQLQQEFDEVVILPREKRIEVTTDSITLEDIDLGSFCIRLHLDQLALRQSIGAFSVIALEPNPASGHAAYTHPHLSDHSLCAGEATAPIAQALVQGRIQDAFQLISRVLHTYNSASPYVRLSDWEGSPCADCEGSVSSDSGSSCRHCDGSFCDGCIRSCSDCTESVCLSCSRLDEENERRCRSCHAIYEQQRDSEEEDDEEEPEEADHEPQAPPAVSPDPMYAFPQEPQPQAETTHESIDDPDLSPGLPTGPLADLPPCHAHTTPEPSSSAADPDDRLPASRHPSPCVDAPQAA